MAQKKKTKETGKTVEAKSAAAGKMKKRKPKTNTDSTIMAKITENVQKVMENTKENVQKRKQEKSSSERSKVANKNGKKSKGGNNNNQNKKKKQKKNHPDNSATKRDTSDSQGGKQTSSKDEGNDESKWSKSKKKRIRALKAKQFKKQQQQQQQQQEPTNSSLSKSPKHDNTTSEASSTRNGSKLLDAFKARLSGSRFRILNEELYTQISSDSYQKFSENPQLFEQYHQGFRHQVASWPLNPVDVMFKTIVNRYSSQIAQNKTTTKKVVVADFGCGDAQLAKDLMQGHPNVFHVHSFDLVSPNKLVTACDMAHVPLAPKSVDLVVFCLALMGTNLADFVREAHRVLKDNGRVQIAEVRSRIEYSHGRNSATANNSSSLTGTLEEFVQVLSQLGFACAKTDRSNKMFLFLELKKNGKTPNQTLDFSAKPCIYKRR